MYAYAYHMHTVHKTQNKSFKKPSKKHVLYQRVPSWIYKVPGTGVPSYDWEYERSDQPRLLKNLCVFSLFITTYQFYSHYIQYGEIGLIYIGFLPTFFLFTGT